MVEFKFLYYNFRVLLICFFISTVFSLDAQFSATTTDVFARHGLDQQQLPYSSNLNFLKNKAGKIPIIENFEFRTETDEFVFDQQEYSMRFDLNSRDERKAYDRVLATNKQLYSLMQEEYEADLVKRDYQILVDYYFDLLELDLVNQSLSMVNDKKIVLAKLLSNASDVNINNWLSNQDDIVSLVMDSVELEQSLFDSRLQIFGKESSVRSIVFDDFISIEKLRGVVDSYLINGSNTIGSRMATVEETKAKAEYALEEAETNKWLRFIQVKYQADNDAIFQNELSFGSSINIPTKSTNKVKRNEAALDVWDKKYDRLLEEEKDKRNFTSNIIKLESSIIQYDKLIKLIEEQELEKTYENYLSLGDVSPLTLLGIQKNIIKFNSNLLDAKKEIYEVYIDLIGNSSLMTEEPRINFLSNNLETIK